MKNLFLVLFLTTLTSCTLNTRHGECVGLDDERDPGLIYETNYLNVVVAALLFSTIIIPAIVVLEGTLCPVGTK